jgi:hypothetical protein
MPVRLIESLATTAPLSDLFPDQSILQAMFAFDVALARAEAQLKVVRDQRAVFEPLGGVSFAPCNGLCVRIGALRSQGCAFAGRDFCSRAGGKHRLSHCGRGVGQTPE